MDKKIEEMTEIELLVYQAGINSQLQILEQEAKAIQQELNKRIREELAKQK
jgi:hypothetical protein